MRRPATTLAERIVSSLPAESNMSYQVTPSSEAWKVRLAAVHVAGTMMAVRTLSERLTAPESAAPFAIVTDAVVLLRFAVGGFLLAFGYHGVPDGNLGGAGAGRKDSGCVGDVDSDVRSGDAAARGLNRFKDVQRPRCSAVHGGRGDGLSHNLGRLPVIVEVPHAAAAEGRGGQIQFHQDLLDQNSRSRGRGRNDRYRGGVHGDNLGRRQRHLGATVGDVR